MVDNTAPVSTPPTTQPAAPSAAASMVPAIAGAAVAVAEAEVPVLLAFNPLFAFMLTAIKAHYNATKTWPTLEEITAAVPQEYQGLLQDWADWKPSGDGTLSAGTTGS